MPYSLRRAGEHGLANALSTERRDTVTPDSRLVTGSTLIEENDSKKPAAAYRMASTQPSRHLTGCG